MAAKTAAPTLAVGDHVRLKSMTENQHQTATDASPVTAREPMDGLLLSIREIKSGKMVAQTKGALDQFIYEIIYEHSFNARYASQRNAPRGSEKPSTTPAWRRLAATLRDGAKEGKLYSAASLSDSPIAGLLDGWRVVKVWSTQVESLERPRAAETDAE